MLWDIMNKTPYISGFFHPSQGAFKEQWFKAVIQHFYDHCPQRGLSADALQELNRDTIAYMIKSIREKNQSTPPTPMFVPSTNTNTAGLSMTNTVGQPMAPQSGRIAKEPPPPLEYKNLLDRPTPAAIDFRDKVEDTAMPNMDDLVKAHVMAREEALQMKFPVAASVTPPNHPVVEPVDPTAGLKKELADMKQEIQKLRDVVLDLSTNYYMLNDEMAGIKQHVGQLS